MYIFMYVYFYLYECTYVRILCWEVVYFGMYCCLFRSKSRTVATSKMERYVIIVNDCFQPLIVITKRSILDVAAVLDPPLVLTF